MRTAVRLRKPARITAWPAAWGIRWVNPSMATVSPSSMSEDTASASGTISAMRRACGDAGVALRGRRRAPGG